MPLAQAFALYAAICARYDREPTGPTYEDQAMLAALRAASGQEPGKRPEDRGQPDHS